MGCTFEGVIYSTSHLRKVLGKKGKDLLQPALRKEMLQYIVRCRMVMTRNEAEESDEEEEEGEDEDDEEDEDEVGELADINKPKRNKNKASKSSKGKKSSGKGSEQEEGEEGAGEEAHSSLIPVPGYSIDVLSGTPDEYTVEFLTHRIYIQNELGAASKVEPDKKEKNAEKVMDDIEKRRGVKLLRLVKRVSGHLLTLIVFEIPDETKDPRLMRLLQDQQYAASLEKQKVGEGIGVGIRVVVYW